MTTRTPSIRESFIDLLVPLIPSAVMAWATLRAGVDRELQTNLILGAGVLFVVLWIARKRQVAARQRRDAERAQIIVEIFRTYQRGIYKRIDENRELLELLKHEAPALLDNCWWIEGWLRSQDDFLEKIAQEACGSAQRLDRLGGSTPYPRLWPGKTAKEC